VNDADASAEARAERMKERDDLAREQLQADLLAVMRTGPGRRVLWWLVMHLCGLESVNAEPTDFLRGVELGRRSIGKAVMDLAQRVAPDEWWLVMHELRARLLEEKAEEKKRGAEVG
jgi:hypothetical protein